MKAADAMVSSSCKSSMDATFVWKLVIVSHVTENIYFFVSRQVIGYVASRLSRVTEHGFMKSLTVLKWCGIFIILWLFVVTDV